MARCPFCEICSGEAPASIVYQDARVMAFMDLRPANAGHVLVIPRRHWETIHEIPDSTLVDVFRLAKRVAGAIKEAVNAEGINIIQSNGRAAYQMVDHLHVHVIPRFQGDAISETVQAVLAPLEFDMAKRADLDEAAELIRRSL